jgi:hypothetical protein
MASFGGRGDDIDRCRHLARTNEPLVDARWMRLAPVGVLIGTFEQIWRSHLRECAERCVKLRSTDT